MSSHAMLVKCDAPILSGVGRHVKRDVLPVDLVRVFGENLSSLMEAKRVQNQDLARAVGTDDGTVSKWRNGHRGPDTLERLASIANYLKVPPYLLLLPADREGEALKTLKVGHPALRAGEAGELVPLLQMVVSSLAWAVVEKWTVPGSIPGRPSTVAPDEGQVTLLPEPGTADTPKRRRRTG